MNTTIKSGSNSQPKELQGIQHLRGIAAVLVVFIHIDGMYRFPKYFNDNTLSGWLDVGGIGVHLFFVISGFIIPYVSLNKGTLEPKMSAASFLRRRFIRIIPFMWACIIGYALLRLLGRGTLPAVSYLRALTLFPVGEVEPSVIWTLRHEILFYSIYCLAILYYSVKQRWIGLSVWFLSPFLWLVLTLSVPAVTVNAFIAELCTFLFSKFNILFGTGFLIGILHMKGYLNTQWITRHGFFVSLLSTVPLIVSAHIIGNEASANPIQDFMIFSFFAGISLIVGISLHTNGTITFADKVGLKLGDASYSIYLIHTGIISAIMGIWSKIQPGAHFLLVLTGITILTCLGGIAVHELIEKPMIRFGQKLLSPKRASAVEVNKVS